jgi:phosphoadenosine phosphosulfate reductase
MKKAEIAKILIRRALRENGADKCAVACSWGKDSTAVLALAREIEPDIIVVHSNTGVDHPLTYRYRDRMVKEWSLNYHEAKGESTFWEIVELYGMPGIRLVDGERVPKCCLLLKDKPGDKLYDELGVTCVFTGITSGESRNRWMLSRRCGDYYYAKSQGRWKCHPIMDWSEADVWSYIKGNGIPYNEFYDRFPGHRVGCQPCTSYISWKERMAKENPKLYAMISRKLGQEVFL